MEYIKLKEIATFPTGKLNSNAAVEDGRYPFFTCSHDIYRIDSYSYDGEYVLLGGNNASGDFPIFYYKGKFDAYQRTYLIQPKKPKEFLTKYLFYGISLRLLQMKGNAAGTATKFLTQPILQNIYIEKRDIQDQERIASILSAYDNSIEVNNKRIRVLEQMAENLYKEWFVRFRFPGYKSAEFENDSPKGWTLSKEAKTKRPKDWHYGPFLELGSFIRGKNITSDEMKEGIFPVISAGIEPSGFHNESNVKGKSLTISASGANAGYLKYNLDDIWAADCSYYQSKDRLWFAYHTLKFLQPVISNLQCGAAQPHVYPKQINRLSVIIPMDSIVIEFCSLVKPIYEEIKRLMNKNDNLIKQRDLLLPRLMSGKLTIK